MKLADMAYELSGSFVKKAACDILFYTKRDNRVVFFGPDIDLTENGRVHDFVEAAIINKYDHYLERGDESFVFYHTDDPLCRKKHKDLDLRVDEHYLVFYNGKLTPHVVKLTDDPNQKIDLNFILGHRNARYALDRPTWNRYAEDAIFQNPFKGLVYMTPRQWN